MDTMEILGLCFILYVFVSMFLTFSITDWDKHEALKQNIAIVFMGSSFLLFIVLMFGTISHWEG